MVGRRLKCGPPKYGLYTVNPCFGLILVIFCAPASSSYLKVLNLVLSLVRLYRGSNQAEGPQHQPAPEAARVAVAAIATAAALVG